MQRLTLFFALGLLLFGAFAATTSLQGPGVVSADVWCSGDSGDLDEDCVQDVNDSCPGTPTGDVPGNKTSYTFGDGYGVGPADAGGTDSYGCSLAQIQDADLDHYCDNSDFNASTDYNDRCWVRDACPGTAPADVANAYVWGSGYGSGTDNGGLDSYGCALAQIQDGDLDHYCDNPDFDASTDYNDRCWVLDSCPGSANGTADVDSYGCEAPQVDTDSDGYCNPDAPTNDFCFLGTDACPTSAEDDIGAPDGCPENGGQIELRKVVAPSSDTTEFDLRIDGATEGDDIAHGETSGEVFVSVGNHTVSEAASDGLGVAGYLTEIECRNGNGTGAIVAQTIGTSLSLNVADGDDIVCIFTNVATAALGVCSGDSFQNVIMGDDNANTIYGTDKADLIIGLGGADIIDGRLGDDCIIGGPGADNLKGGSGNDTIYGDEDNDIIDGGNGHDWLVGGSEDDTISGGNDNDTIYGEGGKDTINTGTSSGSGRNYAYGGDGDDTLNGGTGRDTLVGEGDTDKANGGPGTQDQCSAEVKQLCEANVP